MESNFCKWKQHEDHLKLSQRNNATALLKINITNKQNIFYHI